MSAPNVVSFSIVTSKENFARIFLVDSPSNLEKNINMVKEVFSRTNIKDFLVSFKKLIDSLSGAVEEKDIKDAEWVVAFDKVGDNGILLVDLTKLAENMYLLYLSRSVWTNPRDPGEKQVSFEAHFYAKDGVVRDFQRVLIIRGNVIYDAPIKK